MNGLNGHHLVNGHTTNSGSGLTNGGDDVSSGGGGGGGGDNGTLAGLNFSTDLSGVDGGLDFGANFDFGHFQNDGDTFDFTQFLRGGDDDEADGGMIGL